MKINISLQAFIFVVLIGLISNSFAWASVEKTGFQGEGESIFLDTINDQNSFVGGDKLAEEPFPAILAEMDDSGKKKKKARKKKSKKNKKSKKKNINKSKKTNDKVGESDKGGDKNEEPAEGHGN
ncbi:MAG: hypothetical protein H8E32_08760 [Nitrospinae bacterium]|nr:hypothetical protein [Nitrospinota bacterium]